ncbi:Retrovirus-related Pol polyprotein from transposon TNT 1-94 [Melia azedarach]|uniref:Retrovirus-related Pol polyprotein from transposon TNT 1-94 n=1 Tax=Melia azedarach TaxID=155640 RepID=A0ACC1Y5S2_MELAZ|nr:Retrovirus-related Pol polyprotein from transposon TNT 1-94 [Melia azedarach]
MVLYIDDILLGSNDIGLLHETKRFLAKNFEMKDLGDASFVLGIQIHQDRSRGDTLVAKGDKFSLKQCPNNDIEKMEMQKFPYASAVGCLMYAQVCTRLDIVYVTGMLGRYLSNPGVDHWKVAKQVSRYLQRTKDYMLTYRRLNKLKIIGYTDSDFTGCQDNMKSTSCFVFLLVGGVVSWKSAK